jgi:hypothetical protein
MSLEKSVCPQARFNRNLKYHQDIGSPIGKQYSATQVQQAITKFPIETILKDNKTPSTKTDKQELETYNKQRFHSYQNFLAKKGVLDNDRDKRRFNTTYIDINSSSRNIIPKITVEDICYLDKDPLVFKKGSSDIFIKHLNHGFEEDDQILLNNVSTEQIILRTYDDEDIPAFSIPQHCNVMKILFPHNLPYSDQEDDTIKIELQGIKADNNSYLGNIPTNLINRSHRLYTTIKISESDYPEDIPDDWFDYSSDHFFIILPMSLNSSYNLLEYNFKLIFHTVVGVPLNLLNLHTHTVHRVSKKGYFIKINACAVDKREAGGSCVEVSRVESVCPGYPNPNKYTISLGNTFHNVISVRMISSEFPNSIKNIDETNNNFYWNTIEDGDAIHKVSVLPGIYTPSTLQKKLEFLIKEHDFKKCITVELESTSSCSTFKSYIQTVLTNPFIDIVPEINLNPELDEFPQDSSFQITVSHPNHGMISSNNLTNRIVMTGSLPHLGIAEDILNSEHIVEVIDEDSYYFTIPKNNLSTIRKYTKGGVSVTVLVPTLFRLRFDQPNCIGEVIGFGNTDLITDFNTVISNKDYDNSCSFNFSRDKYITMVANPFVTITSSGPIKKSFAKIRLSTGSSLLGPLMNTFVSTSKFYDDPLHEVYELDVEFFTERGDLVDFDCHDHSYTLEINTIYDIPAGTGISANTGKNYSIGV